jgi:hypothetical protein
MDTYGDDSRPMLNLYYIAERTGGIPRPSSDAVELRWFEWNDLPEQLAFAHARGVLADWRAKELQLISI